MLIPKDQLEKLQSEDTHTMCEKKLDISTVISYNPNLLIIQNER